MAKIMAWRWGIAFMLCMGLSLLGQEVSGSTNVNVKLTISVPPCTINDDKPISVEFGEVTESRIDGSTNYRIPIDYTLFCEGAQSNALKMQITGSASSFNNDFLQTDMESLAVKILTVRDVFPVNSWLSFTYPNVPELWAVPVKEDGVTLKTEAFNAAATMEIGYQ